MFTLKNTNTTIERTASWSSEFRLNATVE